MNTEPDDQQQVTRAVLDTNVVVKIYLHRSILDPKQPFTAIQEELFGGRLIPVYSRATLNEALHMLTESIDVAQYFNIDPKHGREVVEIIYYQLGEFVEGVTGDVGWSSDVTDHKFEETAIIAQAEFLVSDDRDLHEPRVVDELGRRGITVLWSTQLRRELEARKRGVGAAEPVSNVGDVDPEVTAEGA
jgi:predicted nucleic acid-binding protein